MQRAQNKKQGFEGKNLFDILEEEAENHAQKLNDIKFNDEKGLEHTISKETQEVWMEAFNLSSIDESFKPNLPKELQEKIGKEIKLTKGSLFKLVAKDREKYIPQIRETLENPQMVIQDKNELIFAKQIKNDLYLTSIGKDFDTHITIISNSPKTDKTIQNKLKNGKILYKKNAEALPTSKAFSETNQVPFSNDIIPQNNSINDEINYQVEQNIKEFKDNVENENYLYYLIDEIDKWSEKDKRNSLHALKWVNKYAKNSREVNEYFLKNSDFGKFIRNSGITHNEHDLLINYAKHKDRFYSYIDKHISKNLNTGYIEKETYSQALRVFKKHEKAMDVFRSLKARFEYNNENLKGEHYGKEKEGIVEADRYEATKGESEDGSGRGVSNELHNQIQTRDMGGLFSNSVEHSNLDQSSAKILPQESDKDIDRGGRLRGSDSQRGEKANAFNDDTQNHHSRRIYDERLEPHYKLESRRQLHEKANNGLRRPNTTPIPRSISEYQWKIGEQNSKILSPHQRALHNEALEKPQNYAVEDISNADEILKDIRIFLA